MVNADKLRKANPWLPMLDPLDIAVLGKLGEELGELVSAKERCAIQGITQCEPVTLKPNKEWLEDEIADVEANIIIVKAHFKLNKIRIGLRRVKKLAHLRSWHKLLVSERRNLPR